MTQTNIKDYMSKNGKKGGATTKKKYGKNHFSEIGKKGMAKRWSEKTGIDK